MSEAGKQPESVRPLLTFEDVTVSSAFAYDHGLRDVSFSLNPGELILVRLEWEMLNIPLADTACGLVEPDQGVVTYNGLDWERMGFTQSSRERGTIGRTFERAGWVGNLDVDENVYLAERHHTRRSESSLAAEAQDLARRFGLAELPATRPAQTSKADLGRSALVRAFLGTPKLLILEQPTAGAFPELMPPLLAELATVREKGTGVLWMTNRPEIWADSAVRPTQRFAMAGDRLMPADKKG